MEARGVAAVEQALRSARCWHARLNVAVALPQAPDDVVYTLEMWQDADTAPSYLISWQYASPDGPRSGFAAATPGHLYRYQGERLQEYHAASDPAPFAGDAPILRSPLFANYLPIFLADELARLEADSATTVTATDTAEGLRLEAVTRHDGMEVANATYLLDAATLMPRRITQLSNIGSIAEQEISLQYTPLADDCPDLSESALIARFPEVFAQYRTDTFRFRQLPGQRFPSFALPATDGTRYTYDGSADTPLVIAFLDPRQQLTPDAIGALRSAAEMSPVSFTTLYLFTDNNAMRIADVAGPARPDERYLTSVRGLATRCGATQLPAIAIVRPDGTVADVVTGYTPSLTDTVINTLVTQ